MSKNIFDEKWFKWEPSVNLKPNYDVISINDNMDHLKILLFSVDRKQKMSVIFGSSWAHKKSYESFRMHLIAQLSERYGDEFYTKWSFFKIENSNYLNWLSAESSGWTDMLNLNHFVIMGIDFIVDVVATEEPTFKFLTK